RTKMAKRLKDLGKPTNRNARQRLEKAICDIDKNLVDSHERERAEKEAYVVQNIKRNPKAFFMFANVTTSATSRIGPLLDTEGQLTGDPTQICGLLGKQYQSVFTEPIAARRVTSPGSFFDADSPVSDGEIIEAIQIDSGDVIQAINELKTHSASGPDGFPAILLKTCKHVLARPLQALFQNSLNCGKFPEGLKKGIICPIHKCGSRAEAKNYRPISLTSHIGKILERIVRKKLLTFLESNNLLTSTQHGFRPGKSCLTQLLEHYDWLLGQLLAKSDVDVIYLDFANAFDKVDHGVICHKLRDLGVTGKLGEWIYDFLTNRTQALKACGATSDE
ncbi:hypothetical protein Ahia01_000046400, partial [Argonauta hians]